MIRVLVFSRDRAMQLQAALASLALQAADAGATTLAVLYRATTPRHQHQYEHLANEAAANIRFVAEVDFRRQLMEIVGPSRAAPEGSNSDMPKGLGGDFCLFVVDDTLFVQPFRLMAAAAALRENEDALGFSFRLGSNTTECYSAARRQVLPHFDPAGENVLKFRWLGSDGDFGYPLELSSSLYRIETVRSLCERLKFDSPSSLESQMSLHNRDFSRRQPALLCFTQSVAFSAPLNRVQEVFPNRTGSSQAFSAESLADLFDEGKRMDVRALTGFVPQACHQEIQPEFE